MARYRRDLGDEGYSHAFAEATGDSGGRRLKGSEWRMARFRGEGAVDPVFEVRSVASVLRAGR